MVTKIFSTEVSKFKSNQAKATMLLVLHTKCTCDSSMQNVLVVCEDTDAIVLLSPIVESFNGQLFQKSEAQPCQRLLDI